MTETKEGEGESAQQNEVESSVKGRESNKKEATNSDTSMPPNEADATVKATETAPLAEPEDPKVTFTSGNQQNSPDKAEITGDGSTEKSSARPFQSLTKADLVANYEKDKTWVGIRWTLFILFWLAWLAMLVAAVVIIILAPKCPTPPPKEWWQKAPIYEVYAKSFKDSTGDGTGDLQGIKSELDYFQKLGVGSLWLSPVYKSPMKDNGYDIQDFVAIDPSFGSLQDFKDLLAEMHDKGLKLIMDFVPNHSSDQHEWFKKSVKKVAPYTDYYIWRKGSPGTPPTNWKSVFGGSAWEYNAERGEYYLHQFKKEQPDLNLRNEKVKEEMKNVLKYWLDLGVDGFRIDSVAHFYEDPKFENENPVPGKAKDSYASVDHSKTYDLPEVIDLLKFFRDVLDEKTKEDEYNPRIMMSEAYMAVEKLGKYYGEVDNQIGSVSHMPLNFDFISNFASPTDVTADNVNRTLDLYLSHLPNNSWSNYNIGNHDNARAADRFGRKMLDAMHMVIMMMQGTPITYYGDEIGMVDGPAGVTSASGDKRDPYRTPMQWKNVTNAGFTNSKKSWIAVNADYKTVNVEAQLAAANSHLKVYQKLAEMRHSEAILFGDTKFAKNGTFFAFTRVKKGNPGYLVAANFGAKEHIQDVTAMDYLPTEGSGTVHIRDSKSKFDGRSMELKKVTLGPNEGIVITFVPNFKKE